MKYNRWKRNPNTDAEFATEVRRHYAACVSYADAQVGRLLSKLTALGQEKKTVVVLWGDHGWHLGEHAIWGKHALFEESLRSPLIVHQPGMPNGGETSSSIVETLDIFPTLCDLVGLPAPQHVHGVSLQPMLKDPNAPGHDAVSYSRAQTIRTDRYRLIVHKKNAIELYDHQSEAGETKNIADGNSELVAKLKRKLQTRLQR